MNRNSLGYCPALISFLNGRLNINFSLSLSLNYETLLLFNNHLIFELTTASIHQQTLEQRIQHPHSNDISHTTHVEQTTANMSADELDVDAELLGMVGDDSSDDEGSDAGEVRDTSRQIEDRTPSEEPKPSVEKVEEPPSARRGVAQKVKKRGGRKKVNRRELEDELDDLGDG